MKRLLILLLSIFTITGSAQTKKENRNLVFDSTDLRIIRRADALLSDSLHWNRQDDRQCTDNIATGKYSLFCALYKASLDVTGTYNNRRPALQIVRFTVEKHDNGSIKKHRLMDWNNSPKTTFTELKQVLKESAETVQQQLAARQK